MSEKTSQARPSKHKAGEQEQHVAQKPNEQTFLASPFIGRIVCVNFICFCPTGSVPGPKPGPELASLLVSH